MTRVRVAVGGMRYESNSFAGTGIGTAAERFGLDGVRRGDDAVTGALDNSELAGARSAALEDGEVELIGIFDTFGGCGAPVPHAAYEALAFELVDRLRGLSGIDAVYLALHGAMTTTDCDDVEADLLSRARGVVGETPLVVSFDLHAAVTDRTCSLVDALVGYKTCPHVDFAETGQRALRLAVAAARGQIRPGVTRSVVPVLTAAEAHDTNAGALAAHMDRLQDEVRRRGLLDGSIFACQPWLDTPRSTWTVTVTADRSDDAELAAARSLGTATGQALIDDIESFRVTKTPVEAIWAEVGRHPGGTVIVSDSGDSPSAGSPGDSVDCLSALHRDGAPSVLATVTDGDAVRAATEAGVGAHVSLRVGGRLTPGLPRSLEVAGRVRQLSHGRYTQVYPATPVDVGPCALITTANVDLVITSRPAFMLDTSLFAHLSIDPRAYRVVQVKSAGGFRALWKPVSTMAVVADSLGASSSRLTDLPFKRLPAGLWPFAGG